MYRFAFLLSGLFLEEAFSLKCTVLDLLFLG
jgi:hypothetical protein